jgi:hypothetical protein
VYLYNSGVGTPTLNPKTTYNAMHQGNPFIFSLEPEMDWFTYEWSDGRTYQCGPDCLTLEKQVFGGVAVPGAASSCVRAENFATDTQTKNAVSFNCGDI